jgi:hypothetical protein
MCRTTREKREKNELVCALRNYPVHGEKLNHEIIKMKLLDSLIYQQNFAVIRKN